MTRFQSHDTPNPQQIWERESYVSDCTDFQSFFRIAQL